MKMPKMSKTDKRFIELEKFSLKEHINSGLYTPKQIAKKKAEIKEFIRKRTSKWKYPSER